MSGSKTRICPGPCNPHSVLMTDDERLTRLEERYAHLQRHVVQQDKAMLEMAETIAKLQLELAAVRARGGGESEGEPADERPPHY